MSFDPHRFGKTAAVDIGGALCTAIVAARENAVARANAEATTQMVDFWESELAARANRIDNLELALQIAEQRISAQQTQIAVLRADRDSLALQLQDLLQAAA